MSELIEQSQNCACRGSGDNSVVAANTKKSINGITCSVRVRGRIQEMNPLCVTEAFDVIAATVSQKVIQEATRVDQPAVTLVDIGGPLLSSLFGHSMNPFGNSKSRTIRPEEFMGAGINPENLVGAFGASGGFGSMS